MTEAEIAQFIEQSFPAAQAVTAGGTTFFFHGEQRMMPVATLVTDDEHDQASHLSREVVFRLNVGVSKATFVSLLGPPPPPPGESGVIENGLDYTQLDQLLPHPVYGNLFWISVLNPG